jgi:hypothetical protein
VHQRSVETRSGITVTLPKRYRHWFFVVSLYFFSSFHRVYLPNLVNSLSKALLFFVWVVCFSQVVLQFVKFFFFLFLCVYLFDYLCLF